MSRVTITFTLVTDDGDEAEHSIPARYEVCSRCAGTGTHVNPSIDGNGISPEEFRADPDFEESYFRGDYDVTCEKCDGERVVPVADLERATSEQRAAYREHQRVLAEMRRDDASERRLRMMEAGERW
jgi:RecJ-like exonuclease